MVACIWHLFNCSAGVEITPTTKLFLYFKLFKSTQCMLHHCTFHDAVIRVNDHWGPSSVEGSWYFCGGNDDVGSQYTYRRLVDWLIGMVIYWSKHIRLATWIIIQKYNHYEEKQVDWLIGNMATTDILSWHNQAINVIEPYALSTVMFVSKLCIDNNS